MSSPSPPPFPPPPQPSSGDDVDDLLLKLRNSYVPQSPDSTIPHNVEVERVKKVVDDAFATASNSVRASSSAMGARIKEDSYRRSFSEMSLYQSLFPSLQSLDNLMRLHSGHPRADGKESHKLTERAKENLYKSRTWGDRFGSVNDKCGTVLREIVENEGRMREEGGEIRGGGENREKKMKEVRDHFKLMMSYRMCLSHTACNQQYSRWTDCAGWAREKKVDAGKVCREYKDRVEECGMEMASGVLREMERDGWV